MPRLRPHAPAKRRWSGPVGLWLALLFALGTLGFAPEAAARSHAASKSGSASKKKASSKKKAKKKSTKKKVAAAPARIQPVQRDVEGPWGVTDTGEVEEGDLEEDTGGLDDTGDAESELAAIEAELLAHPPPVDEMVTVPLPPPVSDPKPIDLKPRQVNHELIPGETLADVAKRYNVDLKKLKLWNGLKGDDPKLTGKKRLRIREAVNPPPPRERVEVAVVKGDTWDSLAKAQGVTAEQLKLWNPKHRKAKEPPPKQELVVWREAPPAPQVAGNGLAAKLATIRVRAGGLSIGKPSRGRLVRGVELPDRPDLYTRRKPDESYGSTHTITQVMAAITRFRHDNNFTRGVVIGGISRAKGGRFRPHKSHQSGRDVDIRMPLLASSEGKKHTTSGDIDWKATWKLIHAFLAAGEVEYIFLEYALQKKLYKAAREAGVSQQQLAEWIQWPARPKSNKGVIRHVEGHRVHFHVRIRCAGHEKHCVTAR